MSGMALIWAANVKGLKPAAKIVLIQLADFHNKETGQCYPSAQRFRRENRLLKEEREILKKATQFLAGLGSTSKPTACVALFGSAHVGYVHSAAAQPAAGSGLIWSL